MRVATLFWVCAVFSICFMTFASGSQVCHNCGIGSTCTAELNSTWPIAKDTDCWEHCNNTVGCILATFDGTSNCRLYFCNRISQKIGGKTFRKTRNTDCLEYEIYVHKDIEGKCEEIGTTTTVSSIDHCLALCVDTSLCRGITFDEALAVCQLHNNVCSEMSQAGHKTYIQIVCLEEQPVCTRNYTQKCVNCRAGLLCQIAFYQMYETKPLSINTSVVGMDPDVKQIWYIAIDSSYLYMQCSYVAQKIGDTVYRATCTQDCSTFEILTLPGHRGTCPELESLSGGVTLEFCMDKCLDMVNCRGVTFDIIKQSCTFHNCNSYSSSPGFDFMARRCIDEREECLKNSAIIQTCIGCSPGPNCPAEYMTGNWNKWYTNCYNNKATDTESVIVHFKRPDSQCNRYQCSQVQQEMGHIVYRESCNTDCPEFEIFQLDDHVGSCEIIHSEEGGLTHHYCVEKCLDINGCRGTTFNSTTGRCDYHNCTNYIAYSGVTFMWKRCIDYHPSRIHQQICTGCSTSNICQMQTNSINQPTWQECRANYSSSTVADMIVYNSRRSLCRLYNCTWVQQSPNMVHTTFRLSYSPDCPIFRLYTLYGYAGTCPVIEYTEGGVSLDYCVDKCLDMDGCRAVSHDRVQLKCFYHSCIERVATSTYTFVKRVCMTYEEFNPTRNHIQTIKNVKNNCDAPLSTQTNQYKPYECNTTCSECKNVIYNPQSEQCIQYQCDRPIGLAQGTIMMRQTANPDCLNFELLVRTGTDPNCQAFAYDEGVVSIEFCLMRCFDLPGCLSLFIDAVGRNCTYHSCTDYVTSTRPGFYFKKLCSNCVIPVTQTCLNCQKGSLCQSPFINITSVTSASCKAVYDSEAQCEVAVYDKNSLECQLYQCPYVSQKYGSTLYRGSCNNDCSIYEVYSLDGYSGSCDVLANMTEYLVLYPEICFHRCLDTVGCRGVTYVTSQLICYYHECDCHIPFTALPATFWWRYCLDDVSSATVFSLANSVNGSLTSEIVYPTTSGCKPTPIYIRPCLCSTGTFVNLTNEEIVLQLIINLTIDADSTSASRRRLSSADDRRKSAVAVGSVGVAILVSVAVAVIVMDLPNLIRNLTQIYRKLSRDVRKANNKHTRSSRNSTKNSTEVRHNSAGDSVRTDESRTRSQS